MLFSHTPLPKNLSFSVWLYYTALFLYFISFHAYTSEQFTVHSSSEYKNSSDNRVVWKQLTLADKIKRSDPKKFRLLLSELNQQKANLLSKEIALLNLLNAYNHTYLGDYISAKLLLDDIIQSQTTKLIQFRANYTLVSISAATKEWAEGLRHIANNLKLMSDIDDEEHYQYGLITTLIFYNQMKQYQLSLLYIEKLSKLSLTKENNCILKQQALDVNFNLKGGDIKQAHINEALKACNDAKFIITKNIVYILKAKLHIERNQPKGAFAALLPQVDEIISTSYPMIIAEMYNTLAKAYLLKNDIQQTKLYATKALENNPKVNNLLQGLDTYFLLYQTSKAENNPTLALEYYEKYAEIEKVNLEGEKAKHLAFQLAQHKAAEQESQIALLNEQNALLETKQALSEAEVANTRLIIMVLIVSLLLFTFWGGRLYKAHKRIKELAEFDALTGIFNRGHFTQVATSALNYCESAKQDVSVIIFDLDHFKSVNDTYGHATGDWALIEAISVCKGFGRQNDIFARLGGEEFGILLPSCDIRTAALRAEQCRQAIEEIETEASGHDFNITASFGVTDAKTSGFELEKLLADADEAAYDSKKSGRNRITVFTINEESEQKQLDSSWSIT